MAQTIDLRKKEPEFKTKPKIETEITIPEPKVQKEASPMVSEISWSAYLSYPPRKDLAFTVAGILGLAGCAIAYFNHDFIFMLVLFLSGTVLLLNTFKTHYTKNIKVHATGVSINDENHNFADMKSFWINYERHIKELIIHPKKAYLPTLKIPLEEANPLDIRKIMVAYVPEKEPEQSLLDDIVRYIGM